MQVVLVGSRRIGFDFEVARRSRRVLFVEVFEVFEEGEVGVTKDSQCVGQPVHVSGVKLTSRVLVWGWRVVNVGVERQDGVERVWAKGEPVNAGDGGRYVVADLEDVQFLVTVDPNRPVQLLFRISPGSTVNIVRRVLVVGAEDELNVLDANFAVGPADERQVLVNRRGVKFRIEVLLAVPCAGVVVARVLDGGRTKDVAEVVAFTIGVEVVLLNQVLEVSAGHVVFMVVKVKVVDVKAVWCHYVSVVGNTDSGPVMTGDTFEPPYFIVVGEANSVGLIGTILFQQATEAFDPFAGAVDVWQSDGWHVFFTDTFVNQWVHTEDTAIGRDGFGGSHCDVIAVNTSGCPEPVAVDGFWCRGVLERVVRQVDVELAEHGLVVARLVCGTNHDELLWVQRFVAVFVTGDDGGTVN